MTDSLRLGDTSASANQQTTVAILGGGPAGLGAAWQLMKCDKGRAIVLEQRNEIGGNAGSFELEGLAVDYGSHRLHPACKPQILNDLRGLLGDDLLDRPRHGRIRLRGKWIHFPLKPVDLIFSTPFSFGLGVARDALAKLVRRPQKKQETFASVLKHSLGETICQDFYFPYAQKIWGISPDEISAIQAYRRVSAGSLLKLARKILGLLPGLKAPGAGRFYYPRGGYGRINEAIADEAVKLGVVIQTGATVRKLRLGEPHKIEVEYQGSIQEIEADHIWSSIPITTLARIVDPGPPAAVLAASKEIRYRAMILIYVVLEQAQFTPFDAHYFPEADIKLTRLSEPKNYSDVDKPAGRTVLCGELPCGVDDEVWKMSDAQLGDLVVESLVKCGLPVRSRIRHVETRRLTHAYPIYVQGYEKHFSLLDEWAGSLERVLTFGRQGLFAHDNTHHALAMAYAAVDCLEESGSFDATRWGNYRSEFAKHIVED
jgi:protoporphyrinogen oxidase